VCDMVLVLFVSERVLSDELSATVVTDAGSTSAPARYQPGISPGRVPMTSARCVRTGRHKRFGPSPTKPTYGGTSLQRNAFGDQRHYWCRRQTG